jgi:hypothetical protein
MTVIDVVEVEIEAAPERLKNRWWISLTAEPLL